MFENMFNRSRRPVVRAHGKSIEVIDVCLCCIFIVLLIVFIILATVGSNQSVSDAERNVRQFYVHSQPSTRIQIRIERRRRDSDIVKFAEQIPTFVLSEKNNDPTSFKVRYRKYNAKLPSNDRVAVSQSDNSGLFVEQPRRSPSHVPSNDRKIITLKPNIKISNPESENPSFVDQFSIVVTPTEDDSTREIPSSSEWDPIFSWSDIVLILVFAGLLVLLIIGMVCYVLIVRVRDQRQKTSRERIQRDDSRKVDVNASTMPSTIV